MPKPPSLSAPAATPAARLDSSQVLRSPRPVAGHDLFPWLTVPTLLLDETRVRRNIRRMVERAQRAGVRFRPHFKTHQSIEVGEWFRERGVAAITVSSLRMGAYFAEAGWRDIVVAFPLNVRELATANTLAQRCKLGLLVDSPATIVAAGATLAAPVDLWLEVDTGYQRSGAPASDVARFAELVEAARPYPQLHVRGLLTHTGQSYAGGGAAALQTLHAQTLAALSTLKAALAAHPATQGLRLELSVGDTPLAALNESFGGVDELRPGNFVFFDWMQVEIGACHEDEIAVAMAAPVVGVYPERREVVVYGGAVHLSKEALPHAGGGLEYGRVALPHEHGWGSSLPGVWLRSLSQEHGIVTAEPAAWPQLAALQPGDLLCILPVHSCLTADLMKEYRTSDGRRIAMMRPAADG
ncbi:MAG: alanine racemase [Caldilineaceae bacterium]